MDRDTMDTVRSLAPFGYRHKYKIWKPDMSRHILLTDINSAYQECYHTPVQMQLFTGTYPFVVYFVYPLQSDVQSRHFEWHGEYWPAMLLHSGSCHEHEIEVSFRRLHEFCMLSLHSLEKGRFAAKMKP